MGDAIVRQRPEAVVRIDGQVDPHIWMDVSLWLQGVDVVVAEQDPDSYVDKVMQLANVDSITMTIEPFYTQLDMIMKSFGNMLTSMILGALLVMIVLYLFLNDFRSALLVSISITNTGNYDGEEIVQLYVQDLVGSLTRPIKELKDFKKIPLSKGESRKVQFNITVEKLKFVGSDLVYTVEPGDFKVFIGPDSENFKEAGFTLLN